MADGPKPKRKKGRPVDPWAEYWDVIRLYRALHENGYSKKKALNLASRITGKHEDNIRKFEAKYRPKKNSTANPTIRSGHGEKSCGLITPADDKTDLRMLRAVYDKYGWRETAEKEGIADALDFLNRYYKYQK